MRVTDHLNLKQPENTDNVNIQDLNDNADILDDAVASLTAGLGTKVDKVAGKGLSSEDYSSTEKAKLAGIASGAQVNAVSSVAGKTGAVALAKTDVGLSNVDNVQQAPITHVGAGGGAHANATVSAAGFMSSADKATLNAATAAATAETLVKRDADGRFKAAAPSAPDDVARKFEVDEVSGLLAGFEHSRTGIHANAIINGNFDIWQRGTSFSDNNGFTADRWRVARDGVGGVTTVSRQLFELGQTDVPGNPRFYTRINCTLSPSGQTYNSFQQRIESVSTFAGYKVTVTFYARADSLRSLTLAVRQRFGTGGTSSAEVLAGATGFALSTSWKKFKYTIDMPSITGKSPGTNRNDYVVIEFLGSHGVLNSTFIVDIAQVQVVPGIEDMSFQPLHVAEEMLLCQRYFEKSYSFITPPGSVNASGQVSWSSVGGNYASIPISFNVRKRIPPTITLYSPATGTIGMIRNSSVGTDIVGAIDTGFGESGCTLMANNVSTTISSVLRAHWTADAEL